MTRIRTPEDFWARVDSSGGPDACWPISPPYRRGYGTTKLYGLHHSHRVAWMLTHGPIPDGLHVLHHCDNPPCCNPLHLFLGTHADNMRDSLMKGRPALKSNWGEGNHSARLTEDQVRSIRQEAASGVSRRTLGYRYGVTHQTITKIVNRLKWPKVV